MKAFGIRGKVNREIAQLFLEHECCLGKKYFVLFFFFNASALKTFLFGNPISSKNQDISFSLFMLEGSLVTFLSQRHRQSWVEKLLTSCLFGHMLCYLPLYFKCLKMNFNTSFPLLGYTFKLSTEM